MLAGIGYGTRSENGMTYFSVMIDLFKNPDTLKSKDEIQQRWLKENSWEAIGHRFGGMVKGLFNN